MFDAGRQCRSSSPICPLIDSGTPAVWLVGSSSSKSLHWKPLSEKRTEYVPAARPPSSGQALMSNLPSDVLVVVDEVQLPLGKLRLRRSGSAGGHNGLKSVIDMVGQDFPRLRIGVGRGNEKWDLSDHVLARFSADERPAIERAIKRAADAVETFVGEGVLEAMNRYNAPEEAANNLKAEN